MMEAKSPTLVFEQIESHFHKWARFFCNRRFEYWELINSDWLYGRVRFLPKSKIKFASYRIKCDMIDYMRDTSKLRCREQRESKGKHLPYMISFSDIFFMDNNSKSHPIRFEDTLESENNIDVEQKDLINFLTNHSSLTRQEKLIMKLMYINGYCMKEAGKVCGVGEARVSQIHANIMMRLRALDYSKII